MKVATLLSTLATAAAVASAGAGTYTWIGGNTGTWDKSSPNWNDGTNNGVVWVDGNDAKFNNSAAMTISVAADVRADNIQGTGAQTIVFGNGGGTLSWKGWMLSSGQINVKCPASDVNGTGVHFKNGGHVFLENANNSQVGGTYIHSQGSSVCAFSLADDGTLGAIPASPADNIFIKNTKMSLFTPNGKSVELHRNRQILIDNNCDLCISPQGPSLRIKGIIHGVMNNGRPTKSRVVAHYRNGWNGLGILDPGEGKTNWIGRLKVDGRLEIASGVTKLDYDYQLSGNSRGLGVDTPLYIYGGSVANVSSYGDNWGHLLVSGGSLVNEDDRHCQIDTYGHLDVAGGKARFAGEMLNAFGSPGRITVRDGGSFEVGILRISQTQAGNGGEVFLNEGGTLTARKLTIDPAANPYGTVHFNGGRLQSKNSSNDSTNFVHNADNSAWNNIVFSVEAGGAVFDTSNGKNLWWGRPLVSGVAAGSVDGGLKCLVSGGFNVVLDRGNVHTYTGPTRVEAVGAGSETRTLQCRAVNALPTSTTLQVGPACQVGFSDWAAYNVRQDLAQTVARVEGTGKVFYNSLLTVTGGVKPAFDGVYGTLTFDKVCASLSGHYDIAADANGCGCVKVAAGQDISGLTLRVADFAALSKSASSKLYRILDAPDGYTGRFALPAGWPAGWEVRYFGDSAYLAFRKGTLVLIK